MIGHPPAFARRSLGRRSSPLPCPPRSPLPLSVPQQDPRVSAFPSALFRARFRRDFPKRAPPPPRCHGGARRRAEARAARRVQDGRALQGEGGARRRRQRRGAARNRHAHGRKGQACFPACIDARPRNGILTQTGADAGAVGDGRAHTRNTHRWRSSSCSGRR